MSPRQIEHYRQRLLALLRGLERERSGLMDEVLRPAGGEASGGLSNVPIHQADLGAHSCEEELSLGLLESAEQSTREITAALRRLESGTFGQCEACRQPISPPRLEALPFTPYCLACARQRE